MSQDSNKQNKKKKRSLTYVPVDITSGQRNSYVRDLKRILYFSEVLLDVVGKSTIEFPRVTRYLYIFTFYDNGLTFLLTILSDEQ